MNSGVADWLGHHHSVGQRGHLLHHTHSNHIMSQKFGARLGHNLGEGCSSDPNPTIEMSLLSNKDKDKADTINVKVTILKSFKAAPGRQDL